MFRRLQRDLLWVSAGVVISAAATLATLKALTSLLGASAYGQFALGLTVAGLSNLFVYGPAGQALLRYFSVCRERGQLPGFFSVARLFHLAAFAVIGLVVTLVALPIRHFHGGGWAELFVVSALLGIAAGINATLIAVNNAAEQRRTVAVAQAGDAILRFAFALGAVLLHGSAVAALAGTVVGAAIVALCLWHWTARSFQSEWRASAVVPRAFAAELMAYGGPFVVFAAFAAVSMYGDRWLIQLLLDEHSVGGYYAVLQMASGPIALVVTIIMQFAMPRIFSIAGDTSAEGSRKADRLLRIVVAVTIAILIPAVGLAYLARDLIVAVLSSAAFVPYARLLGVLALGVSLFQVGQVLVLKGQTQGVPRVYVMPKMVHAAAFLLLGIALGRAYGVDGVAAAYCGAAGLYLASVAVANARLKRAAA